MANTIRILHCFGRMDRGGAESLIMNIYRNIDRNKVQFDFVVHTHDKCAFDDEILSLGGRIFRIPRYNVKNHFLYKKEWNQLFKDHKHEWVAIHAHMFTTSAIYLKVAKKYGIVRIAHSHATSWGHGVSSFVKNIIQFFIRYRADYFFACSEDAAKWLFGKRKKAYILKNAINYERFIFNEDIRQKMRKELSIEDDFVIGHIGRFDIQKNHQFIIDICKEVSYRKNNMKLVLIGDGMLRPSIEEKVRNQNLEGKIIFTGVRSDVNDLLQAMDVFIFPSLHEGLGIVAIEAQAAGLATIVSEAIPKEAYITDLIEKEYLNSSASDWAKRILKYADGYERKNTSSIIKASGYDVFETVKWLQEFYLDIAASRK